MTRDCPTCNGTGSVGVGGLIGPEEFRSLAECGDCKGAKREVVRCDLCGDNEAKREAWVVDTTDKRKASLLRLCLECHDDREDTDVIELTTRILAATEEDDNERTAARSALRERLAALSKQLIQVQKDLVRGVANA